ncbi:MAG: hypothetical protein IJX62_02940, partial [Clostridia bacterium]|nr:hypothetical protein [Clostridia bacterium]
LNLAKILIPAVAIAVSLVMLNIYDIRVYLVYAILAVFYYALVMTALSMAVRVIRKELSTTPTVVIIIPFMATDAEELSLISFFEENTGISLRSLWSLKYVRKILPVGVIAMCLLFWVSTGVVYVESQQEAVVYRFGVMQEDTLKPGLHVTLPYPFDKTEIHNTETINKITIGYKAGENTDNVWTKDHGDSEYKLLLGSGNELVSLNLRVEYKIDDLKQYLRNATTPDRILEAKAYELATSRTVNTDLDTLLAINREAFADEFCEELARSVNGTNIGIEVVSIIMESIHPPIEVAEVYQRFVAVEIDAGRIITEAEASAEVLIYQALSQKDLLIQDANARYYESIANAKYEVAEFMAAVSAYEEYPDAFAYYRYMEAISTAYESATLVILGEGIDGTRIIWGSFNTDK